MFGWKKDNAPRRMPELSGAVDGSIFASRGLIAGTRIGTSMGWRTVEALAPGDMVLTFDNGLQPLVEVRRETYWISDVTMGDTAMVIVPAGAMGNVADVALLPDQGVLIESEAACDVHGDPFAVLRAKALEGFRGITRVSPQPQMQVITLVFASDEVVYAEGGILLHCPRATVRLEDFGHAVASYEVIADTAAAFLVECMAVEARGGAIVPDHMAA
ncbi:Hint domain-containing protein [uncultured Tateyamaria sp.]|uniref:Hint domain-containing protein n=1 Tax=Tateyamaria sp. 1078 TaxID=3417464 RepID=UPI002608D278|nr:Hint domain-containing protein [uncultured Tateyamaria sp.]